MRSLTASSYFDVTQDSQGLAPDPNTKLREEIDAELFSLKQRIRDLHSKRNAISPIYRLPPEILIRIFHFFQRTVTGENTDFSEAEKYLGWSIVLQVTQHWRDIALGSPELWSNIVVNDPRWIEKCLERSGSNPLFIDLIVDGLAEFEVLELVLTESQRIEGLELGIDINWWTKVMDVLKLPAPLLKELDLGARRGGRPLPNDLFAGEFPRLRDLNLTSCQIDFEGPLFKTTNLASLAIISPTTRISMGDMLQMLQKLRRLDSLLLSDALKDDPTSFPPSLPPIHLPKLQLLGLEDCGVSINKEFLTHLVLPESTQLHFQCNDIIHAQPLPSLQMAIDAVKQAYGDPDPTFPDIRFDRDVSSHTITLGLMKNRRFGSGEIAPPVIKIVLEFVSSGSRAMLKDLEECMDLWLTGLGRAFLERVEIFHISAQKQEISLDTWSYLGDKLVNLDTLMLGPRIGDSFLRYLATCSTPSTSENPHVDRTEEAYQQSLDPESPDAPLDVHSAEVIDQPTSGRMAYMTLRTLNLFCPTLHDVELEALYGALQRRKEEGVGLNELTIHDAAEDLQVLKDKVEASVGFGDSVGEVVWVTVDEV